MKHIFTQKPVHKRSESVFIHNSQAVEMTQMPINGEGSEECGAPRGWSAAQK